MTGETNNSFMRGCRVWIHISIMPEFHFYTMFGWNFISLLCILWTTPIFSIVVCFAWNIVTFASMHMIYYSIISMKNREGVLKAGRMLSCLGCLLISNWSSTVNSIEYGERSIRHVSSPGEVKLAASKCSSILLSRLIPSGHLYCCCLALQHLSRYQVMYFCCCCHKHFFYCKVLQMSSPDDFQQ